MNYSDVFQIAANWTAVPLERFTVASGEQHIVRFRSSERGKRSFCKKCEIQMVCQAEPEVMDFALAALHDKIDREPGGHYVFDPRADVGVALFGRRIRGESALSWG
jgi:hypothetical protein